MPLSNVGVCGDPGSRELPLLCGMANEPPATDFEFRTRCHAIALRWMSPSLPRAHGMQHFKSWYQRA